MAEFHSETSSTRAAASLSTCAMAESHSENVTPAAASLSNCAIAEFHSENVTRAGASLLDKYRGCFMGVLLGDCIGGLLERPTGDLSCMRVDDIEAAIESVPSLQYTDDTSMTLSLAESLLEHRGLEPKSLAIKFVERYRKEVTKQHLYAKVRSEVFEQWEETQFLGDIFAPAKRRFHGAGSNGNGGAMRAAAVALFCGDDVGSLVEIAKTSSQLTHCHPEGYNGAILQAYAVCQALHNSSPLNVEQFLDRLRELAQTLEDGLTEKSFTERLEVVRLLLQQDDLPPSEVIRKLGHSVRAVDAMPMALFCALRSLRPIPSIKRENAVERSIILAVSMGGDTDTIASMAGAITGALFGVQRIEPRWIAMCEASDKLLAVAEELYAYNHPPGDQASDGAGPRSPFTVQAADRAGPRSPSRPLTQPDLVHRPGC
ncbi:Poly(ADP-ribose) glycohydrolase ARH3 [Hypsibius exemplaris]|uniref:ADP-ribosylhydrolase ARH3 n=1 Tax=Hypsibius exemplaris TaxID=2072580 RepID=A0A1W0X0T9_HYPEX|nr:Poly(ADP-ribose) glycohydrolase ARH3 [Hypsibius exemplaris]